MYLIGIFVMSFTLSLLVLRVWEYAERCATRQANKDRYEHD
jgi:hypothetical protein